MTSFPTELTTERLYLRRATQADAEIIFQRYGQDPKVCRFLCWKPHQSLDDTLTFLRTRISDNEAGKASGYLIFSRASGELLGDVGGGIFDTRVSFGYCLARDAWGQGFATEAARAFVDAAFAEPTIWRVQAHCDVENRASARVLEKIGLTRECVQRRYMLLPNLGDVPRDLFCFAKVREAAG